MSKFDKEYLELCKKILTDGVEVVNRTGINTIKIPDYTFHFNLSDEFPILQSKQTFYKNAIIEMLWIWQMQSNDVRDLHERGVHIWDEWMIDDDGIYRIYEPFTECYDSEKEVVVMDPFSVDVAHFGDKLMPKLDDNGNVMVTKSRIDGKNIKEAKYFGKDYAYTIGTAYGYITHRYQHTQNLINSIKNAPNDRRMVKSLWQDEFLRTAVLPSCVWSTEWDVTDGNLNLSVHQRSCDVALGLPFNVTQYATFLKLIAHVTGLEAGTISYSIKDAHLYVNHLDGIKEQIKRWNEYERLCSLNRDSFVMEYKELQKWLQSRNSFYQDNLTQYSQMETEQKIMDCVMFEEKPELWINPSVCDFFQVDNSRELRDIKVKKYKHMGRISFPIAQ